jgi:hypothetical protein
LIQFIEQLPVGVIVALAVKEEAKYSFSEAAKKPGKLWAASKFTNCPPKALGR